MRVSSINIILIGILFIAITGCKGTKEVTGSSEKKDVDQIKPVNERLSEKQRIKVDKLFFNATKAKILEQHDKALDLYKEVLKVDAYNHAARYEIAKLYKRKGILELAIENAKEATRLQPENKWYKSIYANSLANDQQYEKAAEVFKKLINDHPKEIDYYFEQAYMLSKSGQQQKAIDVYDQLEKNIGVNERLVKQKQRLYLKIGKIEKAASELEKLIEANPKKARYYGLLAEMYEANDMKQKAVETYERLLEIDPDNPYANINLAKLTRNDPNREKYFGNVKKAFRNPNVELNPKISILYPYLESIQKDQAQKEEAFTLAEILIETHPDQPKAHAIYGDLLNRDNQPEAALEQYKEAVKLDESMFSVWQQIFFINSQQEDYKDLLQNTDEALTMFPNQALVYYFNGVANTQLENYEEAVKILKQGAQVASNNKSLKAQIYASLGDAYHNMDEHAKSDSAYSKSLSYDPDNVYVLNNYSYYLSLRNKNLDKAEKMSRKANEEDPGNASFQDTYGWILYQQEEYEKAKKWIEKAMDSGGAQRPVILEHYGDVLFKLGQTEKAVNYWKKAKEKGLESDVIDNKIANQKLYE